MSRYLYVCGRDPEELEQAVNNLADAAGGGFRPIGPVSYLPVIYYRDPLASHEPHRMKIWPAQGGEPGGMLLQLMTKGEG